VLKMKGTSSKYAVQIIKKAIRCELTTRQAAAKLNCTRQYVNKLKLKYGKAGKEAFVHGNKGKEKKWKLSDEKKKKSFSYIVKNTLVLTSNIS
jgi:hypothetical protein